MKAKIEITKKDMWALILASLVHDVGKYIYRIKKSNDIGEDKVFGKFSRDLTHDDMSKTFVEDYFPDGIKSVVKTILNKENEKGLHFYCWLGDYISSQERDLIGEKEKDISHKPLINLFSRLSINQFEEIKSDNLSYFKDIILNYNFTEEDVLLDNTLFFNLENLKKFLIDVKNLSKKYNFESNLETDNTPLNLELKKFYFSFYKLYERYLIRVPGSAYVDLPDIDLFNHSKLSSAITNSLIYSCDNKEISEIDTEMKNFYVQNILSSDKKQLNDLNKKISEINEKSYLKQKYFLKVTADFSGIQDFIFNLSSQKALKNLKVRSFLISYFSNLLSSYIVDKLGLCYSNIIFSTGGKFELLIPNTTEFKSEIITVINDFNKFLFDKFEGKLFLSLKFEELNILDFSVFNITSENDNENFSVISKENKFKYLIEEQKEDFFIKQDGVECNSCHKTIYKNELIKTHKELDNICNDCANLLDLYSILVEINRTNIFKKKEILKINEKLNLTKYNSFYYGEIDYSINSFNKSDFFEILGLGIVDFKEFNSNDINDDSNFINNENNLSINNSSNNSKFGKLSLEELAEKAKERTGSKYIGGIKLDVDNLGNIFKYGLSSTDAVKNLKKFSRYTVLSYNLKYFFEGVISNLHKFGSYDDEINGLKNIKYCENIDIIFSGGDDCFIVGAWDSCIYFLKDLRKLFDKFVTNDEITFSASYDFFPAKYPIMNIAGVLDKKLEEVKNLEGKNKINFIGSFFTWDDFLDVDDKSLFYLAKNIYSVVLNTGKRSIILKIANSIIGIKEVLNTIDLKSNTFNAPAMWRLNYYIAREYKKDNILDPNVQNILSFYTNLIKKRFKNENINLDIILVASRLVEIYTKNLENKNKEK